MNGCESPRAQITVNVQAPQTWYADVDGDGYGDINQPIQACVRPMGYVSNSLDRCPTDAAKVEPGLCGCNRSEASCLDCQGVANGGAFIDSCGVCAGGTTGIIPITDRNRCVTGLGKGNKGQDYWEVIPNPYYESTRLRKLGGQGMYAIYDLSGRKMGSGKVDEEVEVGRGLKPGIYLLVIEESNRRELIKLIKE